MCTLDDFRHLKLDAIHRDILVGELELWHRVYLPIGNIVLDVGAGNGETAQFYLNHGAKKIICIESDAGLLCENFAHDPRIMIVPFGIDSIKVDAEGCEENMIIETHFPSKFKAVYNLPGRSFYKILRVRLALRTRIRIWKKYLKKARPEKRPIRS
jgi:hypothetical protein